MMISSWLLFALALQLVWTCVPMRPAEYLECPSVPKTAEFVQGYVTSPIDPDNSGNVGDMIYTCKSPKVLISVDGTTVMALPTGSKISCIANSGRFVLNGKDVGTQKFICGEKCNACAVIDNPGYVGNTVLLDRFVLMQPDADHICAWGKCGMGAFASTPPADPTIHRDDVSFTCGTDGAWKMLMQPGNVVTSTTYTNLQCIKKRCVALKNTKPAAPVCVTQYTCDEVPRAAPDTELKMECIKPNALRYTATPAKIMTPKCFLGEWKDSDGTVIPDTTEVFCADCPPITPKSGATAPVVANGAATCPGMRIYIEIEICVRGFCAWSPSIKVNSLVCNDQFVWDTPGDKLSTYLSLKDAIKAGTKWRVLCKP